MPIVTPSLIAGLQTGYKKIYQDAYNEAEAASFWSKVATEVPSTSDSETYGWLGDFPDMREWIGSRVVKDMAASSYQITNKDWESTVGVDRNAIEDDKLGIYNPRFKMMGHAAARKPDQLMADLMKAAQSTIGYDGQNFYDTDHPVYAEVDGTGAVSTVSNLDVPVGREAAPMWHLLDTSRPLLPFIFQSRKKPVFEAKTNPTTSDTVFMEKKYLYGVDSRSNVGLGFWQLAYGSRAALTQDTFDAAFTAMQQFKADGGRPLGITPTLLVVPPALRSAANKVVKAMTIDGGDSNTNFGAVDVEVVSWLG